MPILLVRRPDGSLGASLNVCRHRGARVALSQKYQASILPSWTNSLTPLLLIASPDTGGTGTFHFIVGPGESVPGQESLEACVRCKAIEANPHNREYDLALQQALEDLLQSRGYPGASHNQSPRVMGVLAQPYSNGLIELGDRVKTS